MNWIEAVDVHFGANGCLQATLRRPEVEAFDWYKSI
jgi:hypothetical protein